MESMERLNFLKANPKTKDDKPRTHPYFFDTVYRDVIKTLFYLAFANKFNTGVSNEQGLRLLRFRRPENQDEAKQR